MNSRHTKWPSYQNRKVLFSNSSDASRKTKHLVLAMVLCADDDDEEEADGSLLQKHSAADDDHDYRHTSMTWWGRFVHTKMKRLNHWLVQDAKEDGPDDDDEPRLGGERWQSTTVASLVRRHLYDPIAAGGGGGHKLPNHYNAALLTGIIVGLWIIPFKFAIEEGLNLIWYHVPAFLVKHGVFESLGIPSYLYTTFIMTTGCTLCGWQFEKMKGMPNQNTLLDDMFTTGSISTQHLWPLVMLATAVLWSGLPLGPELPLLLIFAMFGSWMGHELKLDADQSLLILYYSMAAAVGAFFSYPLGAFWFVLEVPHRMGVLHRMGRLHVQLLGPCAVASLTATVIHCYLSGNPVERLFDFPGTFPEGLTCTIPLVVLSSAVVGSWTGILYARTVSHLKTVVHGIPDLVWIFPTNTLVEPEMDVRCQARVARAAVKVKLWLHGSTCMMVGLLYSAICLTFPHVFSWGESQLQSVLDRNTSNLPFFGDADSPLLAPFAQCMHNQDYGQSQTWCLAAIPLAKTVAIGIVLGTSIQCGHFWGPAYVGAAVGQLALYVVGVPSLISLDNSGLFILCVMASAHVVTYRSPLGISLLLMQSAGYDIIVSTTVLAAAHMSLFISRDVVFYRSQKDHTPVVDET